MANLKTLIFGKHGQVGTWLLRLAPKGRKILALDREDIDFEKSDDVVEALETYRPGIVINSSAYTNVDGAEAEIEFERAMKINAKAPGAIAKWCRSNGAILLHYSTDYVFDGSKQGEYVESDPMNTINKYGRSKAEGDRLIQEVGGKYVILRSSWIYSSIGKNFFLTILKMAHEREELRIVSDQIGSPTYARCLADASWQVLEKFRPELSGVYNAASPDRTSWFDFAKTFLEMDPDCGAQKMKQLLSISTPELGTRTPRSLNSRLSVLKLKRTFNLELPPWREQLRLLYRDRSEKNL